MEYERGTARQIIRERWREQIPTITKPAKTRVNGETSWICPFCGHGTNGDGLTVNPKSKDGNGLKCMGCGFSGDMLDLYQQHYHCDYNMALQMGAEALGITIVPYRPQNATERTQRHKKEESKEIYTEQKKTPQRAAETPTEAIEDYTEYYRKCRKNLTDERAVSYLKARGISIETAEAYWLGFDAEWRSPTVIKNQIAKGSKWQPEATERIIMPVKENHYVARDIDTNAPQKLRKMNETGGGTAGIFNARALHSNAEVIFVVEGIFDALSIIEAGADAIALNGTENAGLLVKMLEEQPTAATLVISLDNENKPGVIRATEKIKDGLQRLNISYTTANICGQYKDANEALTGNREDFIAAVNIAKGKTTKPDNTAAYIDSLMQGEIERMRQVAGTKTGFANFDREIGGLNPGLYVLAAASSIGKTTFALQLADNIAAAGTDVIFFSLEQSRLELVSKSLARITAQENQETAITSLQIRKGEAPERVKAAADKYKRTVASRMSIVEGNFRCDISFIGEYVRKYVSRNNSRPVIFIDYLQILQPSEDNRRKSTKEIIDITVTELKRLSRELDLTIFVISSVNRANYLTPIDFESLKESGSIEFTADCIFGLQMQCMNEAIFEAKDSTLKAKRDRINRAKAEKPRQIELTALKNRYGIATFKCGFEYYTENDWYKPIENYEETTTGGRKAGKRRG